MIDNFLKLILFFGKSLKENTLHGQYDHRSLP